MKAIALVVLVSACATGSTYRSGVGDKLLERAPFYAGTAPATDTARLGHFPVGYQRGSTQPPSFEPKGGSGTPVAALLAEMTAFLDSIGVTVRIADVAPQGTPPDVRFSCETAPGAMADECATGDGALGRGDIRMLLAVGRPSATWVSAAASAMDSARVGSALVITLEIGQYLIRQRGLRGDKEVELGTAYVVNLPWLTSLETPVHVLQLTAARVGRDGRAQRIGAEGLLAKRTSLPISALGAQTLISDNDVEQVRTARRDDLPGQPLVWQVALRNLVRGLSGK